MTIYLVRHALALPRKAWDRPDSERPLVERGQRQAAALAGLVDLASVAVIFSSPAVRCLDTVRPLASRRGIELVATDALREGSSVEGVGLVDEADHVLLCAHGDNLQEILLALAGHLDEVDDDSPFAKSATWVLDRTDGKVIAARYLKPPA